MRTPRNNYTTITIKGLNLERYINELRDKDVEIFNIRRTTYNTISMVIRDRDLKLVNDNASKLDIAVEEHYGVIESIRRLVSRVGIVIGVIISIAMIIVLNMFTLHIQVVGLETIETTVVIDALHSYGISRWKINHFVPEDLNNYLLSTIDGISLVSTKSFGTTLVVNVKEKSSKLNDNAVPYTAPFNMIIKDYEIYSGIANFEKNSIIKKGDIIIYPEEIVEDGVLHLLEPRAKIHATIWHSASAVVYKEETIYERTGNKIKSYTYSLGNLNVINRSRDNTFNYYEVETKQQCIGASLLPLVYTSTTYFETTPKVIQNDFNSIKEKIIADLTESVYNKTNSSQQVIDETLDIIELADKYIVNVYLECNWDIYL